MDNATIVNIVCGVLLIILIVVLIICLTKKDDKHNKNKKRKHHNDNFADMHNSDTIDTNNDNDVVIFIDNPNCGFSKKMKEILEKNGMKIGNKKVITKNIMSDGKDLATKHNINGTPGFICPLTGKTVMGLRELTELERELSGNTGNMVGGSGENVIVGNDGCPFCRKLYKFLEENNIAHKKVPSNSPEGNELMKKVDAKGVPVSLKMKDNNVVSHKVGYNEDKSFYA